MALEASSYPLVPGLKVCFFESATLESILIYAPHGTGADSEESQRLAFGGILMRQNMRVRREFSKVPQLRLIFCATECAPQCSNGDEEERRTAERFGPMGRKLQRR